jgi:hypothetical protein
MFENQKFMDAVEQAEFRNNAGGSESTMTNFVYGRTCPQREQTGIVPSY